MYVYSAISRYIMGAQILRPNVSTTGLVKRPYTRLESAF